MRRGRPTYPTTSHHTFRGDRVRAAPEVDPRRGPASATTPVIPTVPRHLRSWEPPSSCFTGCSRACTREERTSTGRVLVHRLGDPSLEEVFAFSEWNGDLPLAELAVERDEESGQSFGNHPVITGEAAQELRALRDRHIRDGLGRSFGSLPISNEGELYFVWGRDSISAEDEAGLISWPGI